MSEVGKIHTGVDIRDDIPEGRGLLIKRGRLRIEDSEFGSVVGI